MCSTAVLLRLHLILWGLFCTIIGFIAHRVLYSVVSQVRGVDMGSHGVGDALWWVSQRTLIRLSAARILAKFDMVVEFE